jgi:hypothetical protein
MELRTSNLRDSGRNPLATPRTASRHPAGRGQTDRGKRKDRGRKSAVLPKHFSYQLRRFGEQPIELRLRCQK